MVGSFGNVDLIFYATGQKKRYQKVSPRHWTGSRSRKKQDERSKMKRILRCDWLPEGTRWSYLARWGLPAVSRKKTVFFSCESPLLTNLVRIRWLDIGLVRFFACLWPSIPVHKRARNWTWSIPSHPDLTLGQQLMYLSRLGSQSQIWFILLTELGI